MRRASFMLLFALVGCAPHFESGKTQCSDRNECPSGFVCGNNGSSTTNLCYDRKVVGCGENEFYCGAINACRPKPADCLSDLSGLGGSAGMRSTGLTGGIGGTAAPGTAGSGGSRAISAASGGATSAAGGGATSAAGGGATSAGGGGATSAAGGGATSAAGGGATSAAGGGATSSTDGSSAISVSTGGTPGTSSDGGVNACSNPSYPMYCPAAGSVEAGCWASGTVCSTITSCSGVPKACSSSNKKVFCGGPDCCSPPEAGGSCSLPACGCPSGKVCYPDTPSTGMTCLTSDGITQGQPCNGLTCASGLGCFNGSCRKYCLADSDCPLVGQARSCMPTYWTGTKTTIPGVSVCAQVCDPVSPQFPRTPLLACPVGFGCGPSLSNPGASNCVPQPGYGISYSTCTGIFDCTPGYYCTNSGICAKFCYSNLDCVGNYETCYPFSPPAYAGAYQVGYCY